MEYFKSSRSKELYWIIYNPRTKGTYITSINAARSNLSFEEMDNVENLYQGTYEECVKELRKSKSQKRL